MFSDETFSNEQAGEGNSIVAAEQDVVAKKASALEAMRRDLRSWGIGLLIMGVLHFFLAGFLEPLWGVVLIIIGILSLAIRERGMFLVIGGALLLAGVGNIVSSLADGGSGWTIFGILQLFWGIREMSKFSRYGRACQGEGGIQ